MKRKTFLITAITCFLAGTWVGVSLEETTLWGNAVVSSAKAGEPVERFEKESASSDDIASAAAVVVALAEQSNAPIDDDKLRIICIGAHPDDCEIKAGGVAALWAAAGHHVKFVSVTNGDIGHWREAGGPLARRRNAEVQQAADIFGITSEVLDIHDGELMPTLENRRKITRLIRDWKADIVIAPRTNDYHPDHRYTGVLVQDAAYMVAVPFFCPDTPPLKRNPVFLYFPDRFQKPYPFQADIAVGIDGVIGQKLDALVGMESQFVEGGALGSADLIAGGDSKREERRNYVRTAFTKRDQGTAKKFRKQLIEWYGDEKANKIDHAEAFEICEYGRQPSKEELRKLFPFFPED